MASSESSKPPPIEIIEEESIPLDPASVPLNHNTGSCCNWNFTPEELQIAEKVVGEIDSRKAEFAKDPNFQKTNLFDYLSMGKRKRRLEQRAKARDAAREHDLNLQRQNCELMQQRESTFQQTFAPVLMLEQKTSSEKKIKAIEEKGSSEMGEQVIRIHHRKTARDAKEEKKEHGTSQLEEEEKEKEKFKKDGKSKSELEKQKKLGKNMKSVTVTNLPADTIDYAKLRASKRPKSLGDDEDSDDDEVCSEEGSFGAGGDTLIRPVRCYTCRQKFTKVHHFYFRLCPTCSELNYGKRFQTRDMHGKRVLVTGCRIKIGYQICLSLLRCGAEVLGTTRFPHDAVIRFSQEKDFADWKDRLHLFALDFRDLKNVNAFCAFVLHQFCRTPTTTESKHPQSKSSVNCVGLFAIVHNAAQTIKRSLQYTESLRKGEQQPPHSLHKTFLSLSSATKGWHSCLKQNNLLGNVHEVISSVSSPPSSSATDGSKNIKRKDGGGLLQEFIMDTTGPNVGGNTYTAPVGQVELPFSPSPIISSHSPCVENAQLLRSTVAGMPLSSGTVHKNISSSSGQTFPNVTATPLDVVMPSTSAVDQGEEGMFKTSSMELLLQQCQENDMYDTKYEVSDYRPQNTWTTALGDVHPEELCEVMAINAMAPFIINSKLKPALILYRKFEEEKGKEKKKAGRKGQEEVDAGSQEKHPFDASNEKTKNQQQKKGDSTNISKNNNKAFIINVSAMEGSFSKVHKTIFHPHTNMAKSALNMMTRTSAQDYVKDGIYMNSVDTGWITDERPMPMREKEVRQAGRPQILCPIDEIDAAARCLDLIYTDSAIYGKFMKDYFPADW